MRPDVRGHPQVRGVAQHQPPGARRLSAIALHAAISASEISACAVASLRHCERSAQSLGLALTNGMPVCGGEGIAQLACSLLLPAHGVAMLVAAFCITRCMSFTASYDVAACCPHRRRATPPARTWAGGRRWCCWRCSWPAASASATRRVHVTVFMLRVWSGGGRQHWLHDSTESSGR